MHPTIAQVDLEAIRRNVVRVAQRVRPAEVMAVVKADGYGHGGVESARAALKGGASRLAVAHPGEAAELRQAQIGAPIQVFAGFFPEQIPEYLELNLEFTLCDLKLAKELEKAARQAGRALPVHLNFDTGMGRVGFDWEKAPEIFAELRQITGLELVGLMTHFATADEKDKTFSLEQLERFHAVIDAARRQGIHFRYLHAANSAAVLDLPQAWFNLVRPGVMLYGHYPSTQTSESVPLRPAMRWVSRLLQVKQIKTGTPVSYGATWKAPRETVIGTVPVGYADGYRRALSGKMHALVGGRRVPVVGRVCMDAILLDLGPGAQAKPGDPVVLLGRQGKAEIPMQEFCDALNTIPYEITCMVSQRVPRQYKPFEE